jgi:uncharacterized membrane protein YccC
MLARDVRDELSLEQPEERLFQGEHRRALRVAIAIFVACALGYSIELDSENAAWLKAACKWSAITSAIVAHPLIGKCAKTGAERVLGTIVGGCVGLGLHHGTDLLDISEAADGVFKALACATLAATSILVGEQRLKLNYSSKLFVITLILVTFAAEGSDEHMYFISRIAGIVSGVLLMVFLSVVILPKSASKEALNEMSAALNDLILLMDDYFSWRLFQVAMKEPESQ